MLKSVLKRLLGALCVLWIAMFGVFALLTYIPGSRLGYMGIFADGDLLDRIFSFLHVQPNLFSRYLRYMWDVFTRFQFASGFRHYDLTGEVLSRLRFTVLLTFAAFVFVVIFGIVLGAFAAYKKDSFWDRLISVISTALASIPPFCLAIYLAVIFCVGLKLLPVFGFNGPKYFILPTITIGSAAMANTVQSCRYSILEELNKPYVKNLRARGVSEIRILFVHALKNALIPTVSMIREMTATVFVSTFIAEWFYSIPGIGYYLIQAINNRDYGVVMACTMIIALFVVLFGLISDTAFVFLDPQLRKKDKEAKA